MRLTEPGLYVAKDGRIAMHWNANGVLQFVIRFPNGFMTCHSLANEPDTEGDWQRIDLDAVKWPELPPKPCLCYTDVLDAPGSPMWRIVRESNACNLRSIHHPDNDPEAVAMIEAARKEAGDANA